jgi:hypothetical protein
MPDGASIDYVTPVQFIQGLKPTDGKVVVADWTDWTLSGIGYTGLIDLDTNKVYASYSDASAAGARRLWRCWLKAYADITIPYLESADFITNSGFQDAFDDYSALVESFGETGEPDGYHDTYLLPAACLGIGLALNGTSKVYRPEDQYESSRYFQYAIVTKDDKTQAWLDDDLVYVKSATTGEGVTATKTIISGAPAFRVYASEAGKEWAQIKTMNGNSRGYEMGRPTEIEALSKIAQSGDTASAFIQQNAVVVDPYGCVGGSFAQTVLGIHGAQELYLFYDSIGGVDEQIFNSYTFSTFVQFRVLDSRSQWESVYNEMTEEYVDVLTETRWMASVAVPSILPYTAFVQKMYPLDGSLRNFTYDRRHVPHHALCINLASDVTFNSRFGAEPCPSFESFGYKIAYITNEPSFKPSAIPDPNYSHANLNVVYPMVGVRLIVDSVTEDQVEYQSSAHTPSPLLGDVLLAPLSQHGGTVYAIQGAERAYATRGNASLVPIYGRGVDTLWSRRVDQLSTAGFNFVKYMLQGGPDPYVTAIYISFISPEGFGTVATMKKITAEVALPFIRSYSYEDGDYTYTAVTVGYVGSLPSILETTDIFPYWIQIRYVYSDSSEMIDYVQWEDQRSPVEVDRAQWMYDIMPGKYPVIGADAASHISTVFHKGQPILLAANVDAPTWSVGTMSATVERVNYVGDPLKPAIRVVVNNVGSVWPTFPGGWQPQYCLVILLIGGDCYQDRGGSLDAGTGQVGYFQKLYSTTVERLFPTTQWPGQLDQHTWHVPDTGKINVRVVMKCHYVSRKLPTGMSFEERVFELDIPKLVVALAAQWQHRAKQLDTQQNDNNTKTL